VYRARSGWQGFEHDRPSPKANVAPLQSDISSSFARKQGLPIAGNSAGSVTWSRNLIVGAVVSSRPIDNRPCCDRRQRSDLHSTLHFRQWAAESASLHKSVVNQAVSRVGLRLHRGAFEPAGFSINSYPCPRSTVPRQINLDLDSTLSLTTTRAAGGAGAVKRQPANLARNEKRPVTETVPVLMLTRPRVCDCHGRVA
jgi:hypothetical protein